MKEIKNILKVSKMPTKLVKYIDLMKVQFEIFIGHFYFTEFFLIAPRTSYFESESVKISLN